MTSYALHSIRLIMRLCRSMQSHLLQKLPMLLGLSARLVISSPGTVNCLWWTKEHYWLCSIPVPTALFYRQTTILGHELLKFWWMASGFKSYGDGRLLLICCARKNGRTSVLGSQFSEKLESAFQRSPSL